MEDYTHLTMSWDQLSMDGSLSRMQQEELEPVNVKKLVKAFASHELSVLALSQYRMEGKTRSVSSKLDALS
jgi:hypothetical protein